MARITLVLSPHLDDAVLSCAGYLGCHKSVIATVFTEGDPSYEARRQEDLEAARIIGARARHLGFKDAPFRSVLYSNFVGIIGGGFKPLLRLEKALAQLLDEFDPEFVLAPLGVGNHIDHRLLRYAATKLVRPERLLYYEDRPYAFVRDQVDFTIGTAPHPDWESYFAAHYVQTYLAGTHPYAVRKAFAAAKPFLGVEPVRELPAPNLDALCAYRTQLNDLFSSPAAMAALYASRPERYWARTPA